MAWSGGTFTLNQDFPADRDAGAPDHFIDADKVDDELQNIKSGLEACLHRGGNNGMTGALDLDGNDLVLDADGDSILHATADDQIDLDIGGTNLLRATAALLALTGAMTISGALSVSGALTAGANLDLNGSDLVIDADGDSILHATADDQIDLDVGGSNVWRTTTTGFAVTGTISATGNISTSGGTIGGLTSAELGELANIDSVTITNAQWGYVGATSSFGGSVMAASEITEAMLSSALQTKVNNAAASKLDATSAPDANDDDSNTGGNGTFAEGSLWIDQTGNEAYRCVDASTGAAIWINTTLTTDELGTIATQNANAVTITGGSISGITDLAVADGGTGAGTAAGARTNLGLGTIATQAASSVAITGGAIDGTAIGGSTPAAGAFTTLAASGDVAFDTTGFFFDQSAGRVGIGTAAPAGPLHTVLGTHAVGTWDGNAAVFGVAGASGSAFGIAHDATNGSRLISLEPGTSWRKMTFIASDFGFSINNATDAVTITPGGDVGIGNTSPAAPLEVTGAILSGQATVDHEGALQVGIGSGAAASSTSGSTDSTQAAVFYATNVGAAGYGVHVGVGNGGVGWIQNRAVDDFSALANLILQPNGGDLDIGGSGLYWDASASSVGIGTASPSRTFHVAASGGPVALFEGDGSNIADITIQSDLTGGNYGSAINFTAVAGATQSARIISIASGGLRMGSGSNDHLTITAAGNVGVGVTNPGNLLTIGGVATPVIQIAPSGAAGSGMQIYGSGATMYINNTENGPLAFYVNGSSRLVIAANGEITANLPTSAGTAGTLWNDSGTVKVA